MTSRILRDVISAEGAAGEAPPQPPSGKAVLLDEQGPITNKQSVDFTWEAHPYYLDIIVRVFHIRPVTPADGGLSFQLYEDGEAFPESSANYRHASHEFRSVIASGAYSAGDAATQWGLRGLVYQLGYFEMTLNYTRDPARSTTFKWALTCFNSGGSMYHVKSSGVLDLLQDNVAMNMWHDGGNFNIDKFQVWGRN